MDEPRLFDDWLVGLHIELNMLGVLISTHIDNYLWHLDRKQNLFLR